MGEYSHHATTTRWNDDDIGWGEGVYDDRWGRDGGGRRQPLDAPAVPPPSPVDTTTICELPLALITSHHPLSSHALHYSRGTKARLNWRGGRLGCEKWEEGVGAEQRFSPRLRISCDIMLKRGGGHPLPTASTPFAQQGVMNGRWWELSHPLPCVYTPKESPSSGKRS